MEHTKARFGNFSCLSYIPWLKTAALDDQRETLILLGSKGEKNDMLDFFRPVIFFPRKPTRTCVAIGYSTHAPHRPKQSRYQPESSVEFRALD